MANLSQQFGLIFLDFSQKPILERRQEVMCAEVRISEQQGGPRPPGPGRVECPRSADRRTDFYGVRLVARRGFAFADGSTVWVLIPWTPRAAARWHWWCGRLRTNLDAPYRVGGSGFRGRQRFDGPPFGEWPGRSPPFSFREQASHRVLILNRTPISPVSSSVK